ncbi:hypothetical protein GCM10028812_52710 [Ancylobacter sonchi]
MPVAIAETIEELGNAFKSVTGDLSGRIRELEKRTAREPDFVEHRGGAVSLGDLVAASDEIRKLSSDFRSRAVVKITGEEVASIASRTGTVGAATSPGTSLVPAHRVQGIVEPYVRELRARDLLLPGRTTNNSLSGQKKPASPIILRRWLRPPPSRIPT